MLPSRRTTLGTNGFAKVMHKRTLTLSLTFSFVIYFAVVQGSTDIVGAMIIVLFLLLVFLAIIPSAVVIVYAVVSVAAVF